MSGLGSDKWAYVLEFPSGGLGDIFYWMWVDGKYANLEALEEGQRALVINRCRAPGVAELFEWHPKRHLIDIKDVTEYPKDEFTDKDRELLGIPKPSEYVPISREPRFFPSPEDLKVIEEVAALPYVVFGLSGSFPEKNVPPSVADHAARAVLIGGFKIVQVGKTYLRRVASDGKVVLNNRREELLTPRPGVSNLIDRLTVPGACELVRRAAGVVCCDSAIMQLSLRLKKPTFIILPDNWYATWLSWDLASWGKSVAWASYTKASDYSNVRVFEWMKKNGLGGSEK